MNHFKSINIPYFSEENERSARSIFEESTKIDKPTFEIMKYPKNPHIYKTDAMHPLIYSWLVALEEGHKIVIRPEHIFLLVLNVIGSHFEYTKSPKKQSIRIDWNSPFIDGSYLNNCNVIINYIKYTHMRGVFKSHPAYLLGTSPPSVHYFFERVNV